MSDLGYRVSKDVKHTDTDSLEIEPGRSVVFKFNLVKQAELKLFVRVPKWNGNVSECVGIWLSHNGSDLPNWHLSNQGQNDDSWKQIGLLSLDKGSHEILVTTKEVAGKPWPASTGSFYLADMNFGPYKMDFDEWFQFEEETEQIVKGSGESISLAQALPKEIPVGYVTSFDGHGFWYFLSYIPWIEYSKFDFFTSLEQSSKFAYESKYSCMIFQRDPFGLAELTTKPLPIPPNSTFVEVEFVSLFERKDSQLISQIYINDLRVNEVRVCHQSTGVWQNTNIKVPIPKNSSTIRFRAVLEFIPNIPLDNVAYIDALSVSFITENPSSGCYGIALNGGFVDVADNSAYHFGKGDFTCEAWVRPTYQGPVFGKKSTAGGGGGNGGFLFQVNPDGVISLVSDDGFGYYLVNSEKTNVFDGFWHHIAGVRKNGNMTIYFDGIEINSSVATNRYSPLDVNNSLDLLIGSVQQEQQIYRYYKGMLFEVRLWNKARSLEEIRSTMNVCIIGNEPNLVGYWPLTESNCNDHSPMRNNGRPTGMYRYNSIFEPDMTTIIVGKYSSGGYEWAQYVGDHTFVAALKPNSTEKYPNNVDVWFDCGGEHVPSHEYKDLSISVLTVKGKVDDLIWVSTGKPVGPDNPKKNAYGTNDVEGKETAGLYMGGIRGREGACHQVVNRLLWAATYRQGVVTLADADDMPRGYWLTRNLWGIFGDKVIDMLVRGKDFSNWCKDIGFPVPPKDAGLIIHDEL